MSTTAIYTRVSIKHLKKVHDQTHPAAHLDAPREPSAADTEDKVEPTEEALLEALEGEGDDEVLMTTTAAKARLAG